MLEHLSQEQSQLTTAINSVLQEAIDCWPQSLCAIKVTIFFFIVESMSQSHTLFLWQKVIGIKES